MKTMTLGEFRELTKDMCNDARIVISIDTNGEWVHPCANYAVNNYEYGYSVNGSPFEPPTEIALNFKGNLV